MYHAIVRRRVVGLFTAVSKGDALSPATGRITR
jgi:hypothetical protein